MNLRVPFLSTRPETDLLIVFTLTPLWWLTGFNIFIYVLVSLWVFLKLVMVSMKLGMSLRFSKPLVWFFIFQISYLFSIVINAGLRPSQRIMASLNNYTMLVMAFFMMAAIFNGDGKFFLKNFVKWGGRLCVLTALIGAMVLVLWAAGYKDIRTETLMQRLFPFLSNYPFFTMLLTVTGVMPDTFSFELPRLTIYSAVATSTGGFMLLFIPLLAAYGNMTGRKNIFYWIFLALSLTVLAFTVARAAIVAVVAAYVVVSFISRGKKGTFAFLAGALAFIASGAAYQLMTFILNVRKSSTVGRFNLYEEALRILFEENPVFGVGVRIRDDFTMMAVGSHSLYIEIIFVAGCVGLFLFIFFQVLVLKAWLEQAKWIKTAPDKILWKYLGMALIGMDIWLVTDTIFGPPFTTYAYFMLTGAVLALGNLLKRGETCSYLFSAK